MGINVKVQKSPKPTDIVVTEVKLEKDLKSCMRCKYFHGNNHQCIVKKCVKEEKKQPEITDEEKQSKCFECPYPHIEGYCFPCITNNKTERNVYHSIRRMSRIGMIQIPFRLFSILSNTEKGD